MNTTTNRSGLSLMVIDHILVSLRISTSTIHPDADIVNFYDYIYTVITESVNETITAIGLDWNLHNNVIHEKFIDAPFNGGVIEVDERNINNWFSDLSVLEFNMLYPSILDSMISSDLKSIQKSTIQRYIPTNFPYIYRLTLDLYDRAKQLEFDDERLLLKRFINVTYGILGSDKTEYGHADRNLAAAVSSAARRMMTHIKNEFAGHWLYIDTDSVVFRHIEEIQPRLERMLNNNSAVFKNCKYTIEHGKCGMFLAKKKYIMADMVNTQTGKTAHLGTLQNVTIKGIKRGK